MKRRQGSTVICRECGKPFWGDPYMDYCLQCQKALEKSGKVKPSEGVALGAGFAMGSKCDYWKKRGRKALILPLPPIKDVVQGYQPERKTYPGRVYESAQCQGERKDKEYAIIEVAPGKPLVLQKHEYREVEQDE